MTPFCFTPAIDNGKGFFPIPQPTPSSALDDSVTHPLQVLIESKSIDDTVIKKVSHALFSVLKQNANYDDGDKNRFIVPVLMTYGALGYYDPENYEKWILAIAADVKKWKHLQPEALDGWSNTTCEWVLHQGNSSLLKRLLRSTVKPNSSWIHQGMTILITAVETGDPSCIFQLLTHGIPWSPKELGAALDIAYEKDRPDIMKLLENHGANLHDMFLWDKNDDNPKGKLFLLAARNGLYEIMSYLSDDDFKLTEDQLVSVMAIKDPRVMDFIKSCEIEFDEKCFLSDSEEEKQSQDSSDTSESLFNGLNFSQNCAI